MLHSFRLLGVNGGTDATFGLAKTRIWNLLDVLGLSNISPITKP
jgi:hypothetical protein